MHTKTLRKLGTLLIAGAMMGLVGCAPQGPGTGSTGGPSCGGGKCDEASVEEFQHRWAIDMNKVHAQNMYGDSVRFIAASAEEVGLPPEMGALAGEAEAIVREDGTVERGGSFLWGNTQRLNFDHSAHVDAPATAPIVNIIDEAGNQIDPPGYLNIIALKRAERHEQDEVRSYLRNGDILVYFHPEDDDTTQARMHHAAMFYDTGEGPLAIAMDGVPYVHHIDNPVSYGPGFNAGPTSTPFHVFRLNPNGAPGVGGRNDGGRYVFDCTEEISGVGGPAECQAGAASFTISDEMAGQYAYMARNWAFMTNGNAPFASFHDMSWNDRAKRDAAGLGVLAEVDRYASPVLSGGETPEVYCAGLVFTNLNLALNRPLNADALGPLYGAFESHSVSFNDRNMETTIATADLADPTGLPSLGRLVFEPITASDILDGWLEGYFGAFDANFTRLAAAAKGAAGPEQQAVAQGQLLALMEQFHVPAALAEALPPEQLGVVMGRAARAGILSQASERIAGGFRSLVWAATKSAEGREENAVVATPERIQQYAMAYASGSQDNNTIAVTDGQLVVTPGPDGQPDLESMKSLERHYIDNRYVPPPLYHYLARDPSSLISYVGTVIHVDLLSPINGNDGNTGTGSVSEFSEGGPDSSLYGHYNVPNGGRHVQRIIPVDSGPELVGPGSKISTRISAANINDVRVVLHPAGTFGPVSDRYMCDREPACVGDIPGIPMVLNTDCIGLPATECAPERWDDIDMAAEFFAPIVDGGLGCTIDADGTRSCPLYDWATGQAHPTERFILGGAHGAWTITVLDLGAVDAGDAIDNCAECATGGAHSNQWFITLRNDEIEGGGGTTEPTEPVEPTTPAGHVLLEESGDLATGEVARFTVSVPAEAATVSFEMAASGDPDLYVSEGIDPTTDDYGCRPYSAADTDETCAFEAAGGKTYHVMVSGYSDSSFVLVATWAGTAAGG